VSRRLTAPLAAITAIAAIATPAAARAEGEDPLPRVALGARAGMQSIFLEGDDSPSDLRGLFVGAGAALRVSRYLGFAAVFEASEYDHRGDRLAVGPTAASWAGFVEARADTNPGGPLSVRIEVGPGYRWLVLPIQGAPTDRFSGFEPMRLHLGPSWRIADRTELAILGGAGFGWFASSASPRSCAVSASCPDSGYDSETASSAHFAADVSIAIRGWP